MKHIADVAKAVTDLPVLRVNQLDARRLDGEITSILRQQLQDAVLSDAWPLERYAEEMEVLLQAMLWRYTVWIDQPTPGGRLQNLHYAAVERSSSTGQMAVTPLSRRQKLGFLALWVVVPYLARCCYERLQQLEVENRPWLKSLVSWLLRSAVPRVVAVHSLLVALNFLVFLRCGTYSELRDRLLKIRLVHIDPTARRQVAFEYMNRVMIWNGLSEFLMTVLPLVNLSRLRRSMMRRLLPKSMDHGNSAVMAPCGFCGSISPSLPMRTNCNHVFCYYCVASEFMENPKALPCPRCGERIRALRHLDKVA